MKTINFEFDLGQSSDAFFGRVLYTRIDVYNRLSKTPLIAKISVGVGPLYTDKMSII